MAQPAHQPTSQSVMVRAGPKRKLPPEFSRHLVLGHVARGLVRVSRSKLNKLTDRLGRLSSEEGSECRVCGRDT